VAKRNGSQLSPVRCCRAARQLTWLIRVSFRRLFTINAAHSNCRLAPLRHLTNSPTEARLLNPESIGYLLISCSGTPSAAAVLNVTRCWLVCILDGLDKGVTHCGRG
jgi:hypothetical protein